MSKPIREAIVMDAHQEPDAAALAVLAIKKCFDLEYLLIGDLRQLLNHEFTAQSRGSLLLNLDRLLENLPRQMAVPDEQGYLSVVLERCPNSHGQIEALRAGNQQCIEALEALRNQIDQGLPVTGIANEVNDRLVQWMGVLTAIRGRESCLLQEAFTIDIGGEA